MQADLREKEAKTDLVHPYSATYGRAMINTIIGAPDGGKSLVGWAHGPRVAGRRSGRGAQRPCPLLPRLQPPALLHPATCLHRRAPRGASVAG